MPKNAKDQGIKISKIINTSSIRLKKGWKDKAAAAGAKTEVDFGLYHSLCQQHEAWTRLGAVGIALRLQHYLNGGRFFLPQPRPTGYRLRKPKQCWHNSFNLCLDDPSLIYCEGYALLLLDASAHDVEHGFCVQDGKVIEVTLRDTPLAYFGLPYTAKQAATLVSKYKFLPLVDCIVTEQLNRLAV